MKITIYGAGDDGVVVQTPDSTEEYDVYSGLWRADLIAPGGEAMQVHVISMPTGDGVWHVAVGQVDESIPLPDWPLRIVQSERPYSVAALIDAPDGTRLDNVTTKEE